ncbi:MAG: alpha/beta fold hydrolase [Roseicyclus sp.]
MSPSLKSDLQKVFAILPDSRIDAAVSATLPRLDHDAGLPSAILKWADFNEAGSFLRGGVSDLSDYSVRILSRPGDDPDISEISREAAEGAAVPGRVISSPDRESFILFLPDTVSTRDAPAVERVRGFLVTEPVFRRVNLRFNSENRLTRAELRVGFQLLAGLSLREAAQLDRVKVETKRAQIKSVTAKMQCSGQTDLVRLLTGQISVLRSLADDEARHAAFAEAFVAEHFGEGTRLSVERLPDGRMLRCIEAGAEDGHPVVASHGMMFGMLVAGAGALLRGMGLRLLMPIRHGYLDPRPVFDLFGSGRAGNRHACDLAHFIERRRLAPATILGHSLGAPHALRLAAQAPALVARLIVLSTNALDSTVRDNSYTNGLYGGYRDPRRLSRAITLEFAGHYPDSETSRTILTRMFGSSKADLAALAGETHVPPVETWFPPLYGSSVSGIAEDYDRDFPAIRPDALAGFPSLFIHGSEDPLMPLDDVAAMIRSQAPVRLVRVEGAGHFAVASHAADVWRSVADFVGGGT